MINHKNLSLIYIDTFAIIMKNDFLIFIDDLAGKLKKTLPGEKAQLKLEPASRKEFPSLADHSKAKPSSVLALFFSDNSFIKLTFIQRQVYSGVHSGQIAFPGGRFDVTDQCNLYTALRETHEEIGVPKEMISIIGKLSPLYIPPSNFIVYPFVGYSTEVPQFIPNPNEVQEVFALNIDDLLKDKTIQLREVKGKNYKMRVPCYYTEGRLIWGATSMILSELLEVIKGN